jgi:hypothetical protein
MVEIVEHDPSMVALSTIKERMESCHNDAVMNAKIQRHELSVSRRGWCEVDDV